VENQRRPQWRTVAGTESEVELFNRGAAPRVTTRLSPTRPERREPQCQPVGVAAAQIQPEAKRNRLSAIAHAWIHESHTGAGCRLMWKRPCPSLARQNRRVGEGPFGLHPDTGAKPHRNIRPAPLGSKPQRRRCDYYERSGATRSYLSSFFTRG
jgi:hypothetical protein